MSTVERADAPAPAWFEAISSSPVLDELLGHLSAGRDASARGLAGSSGTLLAAALSRRLERPLLLVAAHLDEASDIADELADLGIEGRLFPALEVLPGESGVSLDLLAARLGLVRDLHFGHTPSIVVAPIAALMQAVPGPTRLAAMLRTIGEGDRLDPQEFAAWLADAGYARGEVVENPGEFAVRGGIFDVFPPGGLVPFRLDLFGDAVERIFEVDPATQASDRRVERVEVVGASLEHLESDADVELLPERMPTETVGVLLEIAEITEQGRGYYERVRGAHSVHGPPAVFKAIADRCAAVLDVGQFSEGQVPERRVEVPVEPLEAFSESAAEAFGELGELAQRCKVRLLAATSGEAERARALVVEHAAQTAGTGGIEVEERYLHRGFVWDPEGDRPLALVPEHEVLHRWHARRQSGRLRGGADREAFLHFEAGDHVVHRDHGIARFLGLETIADGDGPEQEYLRLEFASGALLHVPATRIDLVQRYVGAAGGTPKRSTLGGRRWKRQKEQVSEAVRELAAQMLRLQAARAASPGIRFPADTPWMREFEASFPHRETEDQLSAIAAIKRDMQDARPMDRLVCGDVGFGKTEVAIRAAFKAIESGRQVAVLVPTTVLAEQHERTFTTRFAGYPFRVESLSRFKGASEQRRVLEEAAAGKVDVLVGTHRLLSKDVSFEDLGLVVIDEEQRFGVEHKQRLLRFRMTADVLTLSATPIPRTLHMAMLGLRDISSLTTAPVDRRAIVTETIPFNPTRIKRAIDRELAREGQVFFVHNRIGDLDDVADFVHGLAPDARIVVGHGRMDPHDLEEVMRAFMRREADILVSTAIIESGIDIPTANTMFVSNAHMFGLAELHQLRGRVGRSRHRAYCYLLLPQKRKVTEDARKRLQAIEEHSMLGAGFRIAMRDLEIRGA
ncbi:MAG: DEAD/DEAH box helicase, partial [Planctomycetota bacterium]